MSEQVRLSKLMAERGICSRREADKFIQNGWVYVDGECIDTLGVKINPEQTITLSKQASQHQQKLVTVLLHKPLGYVSGLPEKGYQSALMLIDKKNRQYYREPVPNRAGLAPAGRLDIDSTGLIIFTQDGRIAKQLIGENSVVEKEYVVWIRGEISASKIEQLRHGMMLDNKILKQAQIEQIDKHKLKFVLTEGRKRQIRRMCEQVNLQVTKLVRVRIGKIHLQKLQLGRWRLLQADEKF